MSKVEFQVIGKPPKKDGANSMWNKETEFQRIVLLRQKAANAMKKAAVSSPFNEYVSIRLDFFVPLSDLKSVGDLDNFITGICDGLQSADSKAKLHSEFNRYGNEDIHPSKPLLLANDSLVVEIIARKHGIPDLIQPYYEVVIDMAPSNLAMY